NRDYREPAVRQYTSAGLHGVPIHVRKVAVIRMRHSRAIARVAELVFAVESSAKLIDDPGTWQPGPVQTHDHRFRVSEGGPVILRRSIILGSQTFVVSDEVFA